MFVRGTSGKLGAVLSRITGIELVSPVRGWRVAVAEYSWRQEREPASVGHLAEWIAYLCCGIAVSSLLSLRSGSRVWKRMR